MNFKFLITSIFVLTTLNASDTTAGGGASVGDGGSAVSTGSVLVPSAAVQAALDEASSLDQYSVPFQFLLKTELQEAAPNKIDQIQGISTHQEWVNFIRLLTREEKERLAKEVMSSDWGSKPGLPGLFEILADDFQFAISCKRAIVGNLDSVDERRWEGEVAALIQKIEELKRKEIRLKTFVLDCLLPVYRTHELVYRLCDDVDKEKVFKQIMFYEFPVFLRIMEKCGWYDEFKPKFTDPQYLQGIIDELDRSFRASINLQSPEVQEIRSKYETGKFRVQENFRFIVECVENKRRVKAILEVEEFDVNAFLSVFPVIINGLKTGDDGYLEFFSKLRGKVNKNLPSIIGELASNTQRDALCGDFLSLFFCQQEQTLAHIDLFIRESRIGTLLQKGMIEQRVRDNFSAGVLSELSTRYAKRMDPNYVFPTFMPPPSSKLDRVEDFSGSIDLNGFMTSWTGRRVGSVEPTNILIDFYGGNRKGDPEKNQPMSPLCDSMMVVSPSLGDYDFEVFQSEQLMPEHFATTHAVLLKRMSDFVAYLRAQHSGAKIHLYGSSFGGFFGASYAYLQSGGRHNPWAEAGIQGAFATERISPIDGIICHAAALNCMQKIMAEGSDLSGVTVPVCLHFNYDDERVKLEEQIPFVRQLSSPNLVVSPFGAQPFCGESIRYTVFEVQTIRGHLNNPFSKREFSEQVLRFLSHM